MERTLVVIKPDAVQRGLVGEITARFERKGLKPIAMKMSAVSDSTARKMYVVHKGKDFYEPLVAFVTSSPVVAMVLEGRGAIATVREMLGKTNGSDAAPGTIRGDFALSTRHNLVHGSDSPASADREIAVFFEAHELLDYTRPMDEWVYER
ncbi:MAG: nucleoside-diphosphate kinase [Phycisphaerae bacterium]